ncbi:hypothetical protein [Elizabethkingia anophelis]|uniref:hypothetical protein n=1 Tax=Elizabethkingia anophelis TaxID=1117645 RepID=UPI0013167CE4|nr:hypothetical protein [Elizabethkingia anophelis]BBQ07248.1 hypothetical protein JUNP353_1819 [Elizabethkingia anophelis]
MISWKYHNSKALKMVRIIGYNTRQKEDGSLFNVLQVQGGIEMIKSKETGQFYATAKRASVTCTFDEETCKSIIGTEMPGRIVKIETEPYAYVIKETGEEIALQHRHVYLPEGVESDEEKLAKQLEEAFA